jgi:hypothetical protein
LFGFLFSFWARVKEGDVGGPGGGDGWTLRYWDLDFQLPVQLLGWD